MRVCALGIAPFAQRYPKIRNRPDVTRGIQNMTRNGAYLAPLHPCLQLHLGAAARFVLYVEQALRHVVPLTVVRAAATC